MKIAEPVSRCGHLRLSAGTLVVLLAGAVLPSSAQTPASFNPAVNFTTGALPITVAIGDMDGDGKSDLISVNTGANAVSVLLGTGTGSFGPKTDFATGTVPHGIAIADLDGEGNLDIVVANTGDNTASVLLGTGTGTFTAATNFPTGDAPFFVAVGDLDGDGIPDVVVVNVNADTVSVLLGAGDGSIGLKTDFATGAGARSVAIGDLNGDGVPDLAVANVTASTVSVLLGTGTGGFGPKTDYPTGSGARDVAIADVDGDGRLDVIVANANVNTVSVLLGVGDGTLGPKTDFAVGSGPRSVAIGDVNEDGKLDLVTANFTANTVSILLGIGTGSFAPKTDLATGTGPFSVAIGDLNGNGQRDLAVANVNANTVSVFLNTTAPAIAVTPSSQGFGIVAVGVTADRTFTVMNNGGGTLTGSASTSAPFSIVTGGSYSLPAGASQTVTVRFSPTTVALFAGNANFTYSGGSVSRGVAGTGGNLIPAATSLSASSGTAGGPGFTLTVTGTNFAASSVVRWNGSNRTTTFVSSTQLRATISSADIATVGSAQITVFNPSPGGGTSNALTFTINNPVPTMSLDRSGLQFGAINNGGTLTTRTAAQTVTVDLPGGATLGWTATANQSWVQISGGSGMGTGPFTVNVVGTSALPSTGTVTATVTVAAAGASNSPRTLPITLNLYAGRGTAGPVGFFDAPVDGSIGVTGSTGVSGWVVDDVGVAGVKIYRNCLAGIDLPGSCQTVDGHEVVFLGDAAFLAGARPDVEAAFSTYPASYRAGWGLLVLTNALPHVPNRNPAGGGQGPVTFYAFATDLEGHRVLLGTKRITLDNDNASTPFGAIDTPGQGATVSGVYVNFGWALTPGTAMIPTDGSTMRVVLDGARVGTVSYNFCRGSGGVSPPPGTCNDDVAQLFPTLTNIRNASGAIGYFVIDTTTLTNGLHTLAWGVIDNQGRTAGIGSRFFLVLNGSGASAVGGTSAGVVAVPLSATARAAVAELADAPAQVLGTSAEVAWRATSAGRVWGRTGFDFDAPSEAIHADAAGVRHVTIPEFGRLEVWLGAPVEGGYLQANGTLRALPPGSQLEATTGVFTWAPGPGYLGAYDLVFLEGATQIPVQVTVRPKADLPPGLIRGYIDLPAASTTVSGAFRVAGWALDLGAWQGAGVDAVHVWAQRRDVAAAAPVFLGSAEVGGSRPDVALQFGPQFDRAGWHLWASGLPPGSYTITTYFWSTRTQRFEDARTTSVTVR